MMGRTKALSVQSLKKLSCDVYMLSRSISTEQRPQIFVFNESMVKPHYICVKSPGTQIQVCTVI